MAKEQVGSPSSRLEQLLRTAQQRKEVAEKFYQGFCHECECVLQLVTCNSEIFYCSKCGGMFVEQCKPAPQRHMFKDIEKRAVKGRAVNGEGRCMFIETRGLQGDEGGV